MGLLVEQSMGLVVHNGTKRHSSIEQPGAGGGGVAQLPHFKAFSNAGLLGVCNTTQREYKEKQRPFALSTRIIVNISITLVAPVKEKKQDHNPTQPSIPLHEPTIHIRLTFGLHKEGVGSNSQQLWIPVSPRDSLFRVKKNSKPLCSPSETSYGCIPQTTGTARGVCTQGPGLAAPLPHPPPGQECERESGKCGQNGMYVEKEGEQV